LYRSIILMSITKVHRKEKWWFHFIRGVNLFAFRFWWLVLLLFIFGLLSFTKFCKYQEDLRIEQIAEVSSSINEAIAGISNCCSCAPPENTIPCDTRSLENGGTTLGKENTHWLGDTPGVVIIEFDMQNQPDQMDVFYDNVLVESTRGLVSGKGRLQFNYEAKPGKVKYCVVRMTAPEIGTVWSYVVSCPH